jgi:maleylpyruvate isomerase
VRKDGPVDDEVSQSLASIGAATDRLLATAAGLTDAQLREPSRLPGWTRGHVLTHIARNADGLANLLRWARTGVETPMYANREAREAAIEAGASRPGADLTADLRVSAAAFADEAARLPGEAWTAPVRGLQGPAIPAAGVLDWRLREVEIHHVDLAAGYRPADWPRAFVAATLPQVAGQFGGRDDAPACLLRADGMADAWRIGADRPGTAPVTVQGPAASLLAWLTGRSDGSGLRVAGNGAALPELPAWG